MAKKQEEKQDAILTHNDKTYNVSDLSEEARKQLANVQITETEIKRLKMQLAINQTALSAYQQALVAVLPQDE